MGRRVHSEIGLLGTSCSAVVVIGVVRGQRRLSGTRCCTPGMIVGVVCSGIRGLHELGCGDGGGGWLPGVPLRRVKDHGCHTPVEGESSSDEGGASKAILLLQVSDDYGHYNLTHTGATRHQGVGYVPPADKVVWEDEGCCRYGNITVAP